MQFRAENGTCEQPDNRRARARSQSEERVSPSNGTAAQADSGRDERYTCGCRQREPADRRRVGALPPRLPKLDRDASDRTFDRQLAYLGLLDDAAPLFREGCSVPGVGVLLAL
ncbi:MAG: hypothetical protein WCD75_22110, partial [Rhodoplanes sp.]